MKYRINNCFYNKYLSYKPLSFVINGRSSISTNVFTTYCIGFPYLEHIIEKERKQYTTYCFLITYKHLHLKTNKLQVWLRIFNSNVLWLILYKNLRSYYLSTKYWMYLYIRLNRYLNNSKRILTFYKSVLALKLST